MKQYLLDIEKNKRNDGLFNKKLNLLDIEIKANQDNCIIGIDLLDKDDIVKEGIIYFDGENNGMVIYKVSRKKIYAIKLIGSGLYTMWIPDMYITFCPESNTYSVTYREDQLYILPNTFHPTECPSYTYPNSNVAKFFRDKKAEGFVTHSSLCLGNGLYGEQLKRSAENLENFSEVINQLLSAKGNCDLCLHQGISSDIYRSNVSFHKIFNKYSELSKLMNEDEYVAFSKFYLNLLRQSNIEERPISYYIDEDIRNQGDPDEEIPIFIKIIDHYMRHTKLSGGDK